MQTAEQNHQAEEILTAEDAINQALGEEVTINGRPARQVELQEPIKRGEQVIDKVHVRKPRSGELRGVYMEELLRAKTDEIMKVLPRVTVPPLLKHEVENLDPYDLVVFGMALVNFFAPKTEMP